MIRSLNRLRSLNRCVRQLGVALVGLCLISCAQAQTTDRIEDLVRAYHEAGQFDGAVLVTQDDEVLYRGAVGLANAEWGIPNAPDTRFRIASVTKQFTAALVLTLVEEGLVDLQTPITRYVPGYRGEVGDQITIHQLLAHTSGVPNYTALPDFHDFKRNPYSPRELVALTDDHPLDFEPGTGGRYSNTGYALLGIMIEAVTGQPYAQAVQERLLDPLGMTDSVADDVTAVYDRAASGYARLGDGVRRADYADPTLPYAAGMLISTLDDLATWNEALTNGRFLTPESLALMTAPHAELPWTSGTIHYGYGLMSDRLQIGERMVRTIEHAGGADGFSSWLRRVPERDAVIIILSNAMDRLFPMLNDLTALVYGDAVEAPRPSVRMRIRRALQAGGVEAAETTFRTAHSDTEATANDLNTLGYEALGRGDVTTALVLFHLNAEAFPDSWNVHDSLGEALAAAGRTAEAVASYERSLDLNPDNTNGREVLERLRRESAN